MPGRFLVDTGQLFGMYDPGDQYHARASAIAGRLEEANAILLPWPCLYEAMQTRFVKRRDWMVRLEAFLRRPNIAQIDDARYREGALQQSFKSSRAGRTLSLVDCVIRLMLDDRTLDVDYLVTFNPRDFSDVCQQRRLEIVDRWETTTT